MASRNRAKAAQGLSCRACGWPWVHPAVKPTAVDPLRSLASIDSNDGRVLRITAFRCIIILIMQRDLCFQLRIATKAMQANKSNDTGGALRSALSNFFRNLPNLSRVLPRSACPKPQSRVDSQAFQFFSSELAEHLAACTSADEFINVWDIAGIGRREVRNVAVLAWVLNPLAHSRGLCIWNALLRQIQVSTGKTLPIPVNQVIPFTVRTEVYPLSDAERVDIALEASNFFAILEAKVDAAEGINQTERYLRIAKTRAGDRPYCVLYITRELATTLSNRDPHLTLGTWKDISKSIEEVIGHQSTSTTRGFSDRLMLQFARHARAL